ncbi:hypothetical protein [Intestinibacter sp.]
MGLIVLESGFPLNMFNEEGKNESVKIFSLTGFTRNKIININMKKT